MLLDGTHLAVPVVGPISYGSAGKAPWGFLDSPTSPAKVFPPPAAKCRWLFYLAKLEKLGSYPGGPLRTAETLTLRHDVIFSGNTKLRVVAGADIQTIRDTGHGFPT